MSKKMTTRSFISLASSTTAQASASGFLSGFRFWLENGELSEKVSPILAKVDSKEILPSVGLKAITNIAISHVISSETSKLEKALVKGLNGHQSDKPYQASIKTAEGTVATVTSEKGEEKELVANFDHLQEAERWCHRRLDSGASDWVGEVFCAKLFTKEGPNRVIKITRTNAMYAMYKVQKSPFMHQNKASGSLRPQMKVKAKHQSFSRG